MRKQILMINTSPINFYLMIIGKKGDERKFYKSSQKSKINGITQRRKDATSGSQ